jgi:ribosomal protein S18 acetylase RimI-like enzyme
MQNSSGMAVVPATDFSRGELTALWNRAYEGYFVPIAFDEQRFERHLRRGEVDLSLSRVLTMDGAACGISLAGRRGPRAYLAGFGIADSHRRQGLAGQLIKSQAAALSQAGIGQAFLEVIEQNPARTLYRQAGFKELRTLDMREWSFDKHRRKASTRPEPAALQQLHRACAEVSRPTWRREWPTVLDALVRENAVALGVWHNDTLCAYAVMPPAGDGQGALLDAAALDETAAHELLDALATARPGTRWRLVDEPEGSPLLRAAGARGAVPVIRQIEMALTLHQDNDAPFA